MVLLWRVLLQFSWCLYKKRNKFVLRLSQRGFLREEVVCLLILKRVMITLTGLGQKKPHEYGHLGGVFQKNDREVTSNRVMSNVSKVRAAMCVLSSVIGQLQSTEHEIVSIESLNLAPRVTWPHETRRTVEIPVGVGECSNGGQLKVEVGGWRAWFQLYKLQLA